MRFLVSACRLVWPVALVVVLLVAQACDVGFKHDLQGKTTSEPSGASGSWSPSLGELLWPLIEEHDTEYAPGYSEQAFRSLKLGAEQHTVEQALGSPLEVKLFPDGEIYWYYSRHGERSENYFVRILVFDEQKRLLEKRHSFYLD